MKAIEGIKSGLANKESSKIIARKLYLSYPTEVFEGNADKEFFIKNSISSQFNVPFSSIEIVGSGKTGLSFFKNKKFEAGNSDLDIAIISLPLFNLFLETSHEITNGYTDLTKFALFRGQATDRQFRKGITNGYINPFFMPNCAYKSAWLKFYNNLSNNYSDLFKSINCGVYASEYFFESKQEECISQYLKTPIIYDEISGKV